MTRFGTTPGPSGGWLLLHAAWSWPAGLAAGAEAASGLADHSSFVASSPLRLAVVLAVAVLVHALPLVAASLAGRAALRWEPTRRLSDRLFASPAASRHALAALAAAVVVWLSRSSPVQPLLVGLLTLGVAGGTILLARRPAAERALGLVAALIATVLAACVVLAAAGFALSRAPARRAPVGGGATSVVLITIDTMRWDAAPGGTVPTPALDALAAQGITYAQARAPAPWTDPSLWGLLTGSHPRRLRTSAHRYAPAEPTIAARLGEGFERRALLTNRFGSSSFHGPAAASWDVLESAGDVSPLPLAATRWLPLVRRVLRLSPRRFTPGLSRVDAVTDAALDHLDALTRGPFLLWVHALDPHAPYDPPARFRAPGDGSDDLDELLTAQVRRGHFTDAADRDRLRSLHEGEVRFVDEQVGRLAAALKARGAWDDVLVIFAADHGEELWEHGLAGHGHSLRDVVLRVPLIVKLPSGPRRAPSALPPGSVVEEPVSLLDVAPSILAVTRAPSGDSRAPSGDARTDGVVLPGLGLPRDEGVATSPLRHAFSELLFFGEREGVLRWPWKLVRETASNRVTLHRLDEDPAEWNDLADERPDIVERLRDDLRPMERLRPTDAGAEPMDADTERRLRALGYVR